MSAARQERKVVTVLFADLVGFTSRAETMDPEDVDALLSGYHRRVRGELERYGGTVEKFIGDAVMAVFGAPVAHEDDPERAVRAALAIRDWARDEEGLEVRVGINTGEALVKLGVRPEAGEGMASGDVVNTAARLQAAAPVNGVLVGETAYRATDDVIRYEPAEPVQAKGKAEPVRVWEAVEPRSRLGVDVVQTGAPLVGRQRELELLAGALARARQEREPQLVTLVGVPGIGKSRLVYELSQVVERDPDLIVWRQGRSLPYGEGVTYWALAEMIKAQAGILETDGADEARAKLHLAVAGLVGDEAEARWLESRLQPLAGLVSDGRADSEGREERFAAWRRFLEAIAERDPTVLVFEDLHWADDDLLDFVDHLVEWAAGVPLLVVGTARPELLERRTGWGGGKPNALTLSLSPLSDDDTARLIAALLERSVLPAEQQADLLARAGGNPLYAEQFVRMLVERGSDDLPMPETVQGIIAARLDALPEEEKALLQAAAVLGKVFWLGAAATVAEADVREAEARLHALERKEFVRRERRPSVGGEAEYAFRHLLVRDVAYGQIPRAARAEQHRLAAEWVESLGRHEDHAEMLAHHYVSALELARAAGQEASRLEAAARRALREAGDRARALHAYGAALRFYQSALELWPQGELGRGQLLLRLGEILTFHEHYGPRTPQALTDARDALLVEGNLAEAAEAEILLGMSAYDAGFGSEAAEHTLRAVELAEQLGPVRSKAFVFGWSANRFVAAGIPPERAVVLAAEGAAIARSLAHPELQANALNSLGICRVLNGDYEGGVASLEEALALAMEVSPFQAVRAYGNLASILSERGELRRARELHEQGLELARAFTVGFARWLALELVLDRYHAGEWEEAEAEIEAELLTSDASPFFMEGVVRGVRGHVLLARGDLAGAVAEVERGLELARGAMEHQALCPALGDYAFCLLEAGRTVEAERAADELAGIVREGLSDLPHYWFLDLAFVLSQLGRGRELRSLASSSPVRTRWMEAALLYAEGGLDAAAEVLDDMGARPAEAYVRLKAGDEASVRRALEFWRSVGATRYVNEAESLLAASA
jgi:class 3 adenylate cyclase/tetratricopeptide (TPR) repeat protein